MSTTSQSKLIFQNVTVNYVVTGTELLIGVFMLPFNVAHLGQSAYGLWVLVASVTVYFSMFDLGYGVALVRFAARYRAKGDTKGLNEIISTMFVVFSAVGLVAFTIALLISLNLEKFFPLTPDQHVRAGSFCSSSVPTSRYNFRRAFSVASSTAFSEFI